MPTVRLTRTKTRGGKSYGAWPSLIWLDGDDGTTRNIGIMRKAALQLWVAEYTHPRLGPMRLGARLRETLFDAIKQGIEEWT